MQKEKKNLFTNIKVQPFLLMVQPKELTVQPSKNLKGIDR
jgi:hypothetical protein